MTEDTREAEREQQVRQAIAYAEAIVVEADGYPMSHSAAAMRTLLANAYLAGAEAANAAGQEAGPDYKTAWDEINRVYDEADVLLKREPRSYLGWNWVHALVDALRQRQAASSPRPSGEDR